MAAHIDPTPDTLSSSPSPRLAADLWLALVFCTRLPLPAPKFALELANLGRAMKFFPVVGLVVGLIGAAAYAIAVMLLPPFPAALLAIAATVLVTGALHEDGLADLADGFGGGKDKANKLAIMRDSRIGSYGVITLVLALGLRAAALASLAKPGPVAGALIAAHALARGAIPVTMQGLAPARSDGLGASIGQPPAATAGIAATLAVAIAALALPPAAAAAALAGATLGSAAIALLAHRQIGGYTGDVLGAAEQTAETLALLAVVAVMVGGGP
jgi:adenosylcobinamide-GDP ribazoletransferase